MTGDQGVQRSLHRCTVKIALHAHSHWRVVSQAFGVQLPEQPLAVLRARHWQRLLPVKDFDLQPGALLSLGYRLSEGLQVDGIEQGTQREVHAQLLAHP